MSRSLKKCKYIKQGGKYVTDTLKFVGLELNLQTCAFRSQTRGGKSLPLCAQKRAYLALTDELRLLAEAYVTGWHEETFEGCKGDLAPYPYLPHSPSESVRRVLSWLTSKGVDLSEPVKQCS